MQALKKDKTVACSSYRRLIRIELVDMCQYIIHIREKLLAHICQYIVHIRAEVIENSSTICSQTCYLWCEQSI